MLTVDIQGNRLVLFVAVTKRHGWLCWSRDSIDARLAVGRIYIVDAPLDVKLESEYLALRGD
jgi:hypothetical protein